MLLPPASLDSGCPLDCQRCIAACSAAPVMRTNDDITRTLPVSHVPLLTLLQGMGCPQRLWHETSHLCGDNECSPACKTNRPSSEEQKPCRGDFNLQARVSPESCTVPNANTSRSRLVLGTLSHACQMCRDLAYHTDVSTFIMSAHPRLHPNPLEIPKTETAANTAGLPYLIFAELEDFQ